MSTARLSRWLLAGVVLASLGNAAAVAQQTSSNPSSSTTNTKSNAAAMQLPIASTATDSATASTAGVAQPAYLTAINGVQGVLAETLDGRPVAAQSIEEKFNPASAVKLATAFAALKAFGPDHRFTTGVWISGNVDRATSTLTGDLVITGRDPSFHYEHAIMMVRELNDRGIRAVKGNLIVAPGFTMNFDWSAHSSGEDFRVTADAATRSGNATRAWIDDRTLVGDNQSLSSVPSLVIDGEVLVGAAPEGAQSLLTRKSSRLVDILKVLLCYSNNFMAERIGETVGGPEAVRRTLIDQAKINPDEIYLSSTSGLGVNRVTPSAMMKILRALRTELRMHRLSLSDILPVAGIDPGTLEDRYTFGLSRGSVIAKTGTLTRTDGGASALVGELNTRSGRVILFVILNQRGNVLRFRQNQDQIVNSIQNALGGPAPFPYSPVRLAMRLADSGYATTGTSGEYEPKPQ